MSSSPPLPPLTPTPSESSLFDYILTSLTHPLCPPSISSSTLRVAGGWVRDKLLNKQSDDIDIAIDTGTGTELAEWLCEYADLTKSNQETTAGGGKEDNNNKEVGKPSRYHKILANPSQSKHLETATMKVHHYSLDLVNLRSESYASSSRIPSVEIGTVGEDAVRRDFTCNALFYNLSTCKVEDYTGRGIKDLTERVLRTPLEARVTFSDDPLRLLRAVRFAGRLGFTLDRGVVEAAGDKNVREGLINKVSRERIGKEVAGFFRNSQGAGESFRICYKLGLINLLYGIEGWGIDVSWDWVKHFRGLLGGLKDEEVRVLYLSGPLGGCGGGEVEEVNKNGTVRMVGVAVKAVRDGLKQKTNDAARVGVVTGAGLGGVIGMVKRLEEGGEVGRLEVGMWVRKGKEDWRVMTRLAGARRMWEVESRGGGEVDMTRVWEGVRKLEELVEKTYEFEGVWKLKGVLGGGEIKAALGLGRGPEVGVWMEEQIKYTLEKGKDVTKEMIEYLVEKKKRRDAEGGGESKRVKL